MIRADKLIASQISDLSRKDARELFKKGRVSVNGKKLRADDKISENDEIAVDGKVLNVRTKVYIMMNKPAGVVCSTRDSRSKTVLEILSEELYCKGLFPAGRLDKDSTGFVLLTNDGETAHKMLSPKNHVPKTYLVGLKKQVLQAQREEYAKAFADGLEIDGGDVCKAAELEFEPDGFTCRVVLYEGMYHQIKRMFAALGNKVEWLHRTQIGEIKLDSELEEGEARELTKDEKAQLLGRKQGDSKIAKTT